MYLFINHYAFDQPNEEISKKDVIEALDNLGKLFINLKKQNIDLIINQNLSNVRVLGDSLYKYIKNLDSNTRLSLISLLAKIKPFCSDTDTSFEKDEILAFDNCKEKVDQTDICYTFLSCALYYLSPILTINNICSKKQFLNEEINISCDSKEYILSNFHLVPYSETIKKLYIYQKEKKLNELNKIDNWFEYKDFVNKNFSYCKITDHCLESLKDRYSYTNSYSKDFRNKVQRLNDFVDKNGGNPLAIDFKEISQKHYSPESSTRIDDLKRSHSGIKNFLGKRVNLNWHTWIQKDDRVYFEREIDHICFVHYEKKV
ncbi:hypothetical protein [Sulfurospirillum arcachonense]|uniref:hypothetical protein n=1 Tax=Sulfurospirillum arcachonense TaxID=57666 RepID=UPI000469C977|nr:hypothetical protein [Sulfurospirillum arcachonense]